jgi:MFS family permease
VGVIFAAFLGLVLTSRLSTAEMARWGWRVPLWFGCLIIPLLLLLRRSLEETEVFRARKRHPGIREILVKLASNWRLVFLGFLLVTMNTVFYYMITAYTPTFGTSILHLSPQTSMTVTLCVGVSNLFWMPVMGSLSDRIGRRPLLLAFTVVTLLTAYPALTWLSAAPSFSRLLEVELWFSCLFCGYSASMAVFLTEIMPVDIRTTSFAFAYSCAAALFGGFTPAICTYLIHATGNRAMPGVWVAFAAVCGLTSTLLLSTRRVAKAIAAGAR